MALIELRQWSVPGRLPPLDLELQAGELLGIIGPNGAGKSSLLGGIASVVPSAGRIRLDGADLHDLPAFERARRIALQPQSVEVVWSLKVRDVVALGRLPWGDDDPDIIQQAMEQAGIIELADRTVDHLSGGEQARVWLARVLANQPRIWLADEPIASLDLRYQREVMQLLRRFADKGGAVMLAIHDLPLATRYCDRLCLLDSEGRSAVGSISEVMTEERLSKVFGLPVQVDLQADPPVIQAL